MGVQARGWVCKGCGVAVDMFGWDVKEMWLPPVGDETLMDDVAAVIFVQWRLASYLKSTGRLWRAGVSTAIQVTYCQRQCLATPSGAGTAGGAQG